MKLKWFSLLLVLAVAAGAADSSAITGTWKLRLDRSKMTPNQIKTEVAVITQKDGNTWHYVYDFVYNDGSTRHNEVDRIFDGTARAVGDGLMETSTHWDEFNWLSRRTKDGKMTTEILSTISADRKTQTVHRTIVTAKETTKEEIIFERAE
jgi:hypothetical protein